jgi:NAD(P)-dependent dehydrogenase (short-subunit alcohol dehydrogenase family)
MTDRAKWLTPGNAALTPFADSDLLGLIEPDDIAGTALYLASDQYRMVTGQVLPGDTGVTKPAASGMR